jgi:hypothetical protein
VARALQVLPVITGEFAAGRLSYSKVRALTRMAAPETEADLVELALPMTASQLDRFATAHRRVSEQEEGQVTAFRRLAWRIDEDGTMSGTFRLPPLDGAVLVKALRAAAGDLEHPHNEQRDKPGDVPAGAPSADSAGRDGEDAKPGPVDTASLADALVAVAESFLAEKIAAAENPDVYQVIVHASADMLPPAWEAARRQAAAAELSGELLPEMESTAADVPAGTPPTVDAGALPGRAAGPGRCHVEDGPAISVTTMRMLTCEAALSWMTHDRDGSVLDVGRRSRRPTAAIRRAARERDACRCRFPGCDSRRVDLHHVEYWSKGRPDQAGQPDAARPGGRDRCLPRRRYHAQHYHPGLVRRQARPRPRHLCLLRQRREPGQTRPAGNCGLAAPYHPEPGPAGRRRNRLARWPGDKRHEFLQGLGRREPGAADLPDDVV